MYDDVGRIFAGGPPATAVALKSFYSCTVCVCLFQSGFNCFVCTARCHQCCVCVPQQEEGGVPRRAISSSTARRDVGLIRVDLRSTTSVPRRARPRLIWNIRPESCEALICCGGGSGFEPYSIQFNSIQSNSVGTTCSSPLA